MKNQYKIGLVALAVLWLLGTVIWYLHAKNIAVLNPAGQIAARERRLIIFTVLLGLIVVLPVYAMLAIFAWKYREGRHAAYSPELSGNAFIETLWWGIPSAIILALSVITWQTSHSLDPFKPLNSRQSPLVIEAVALDWKWLFIYPQQNIASVNYVQFPAGRPVDFYITADAPMNSLWIPQLGSQIYAMPGMSTQLHLIADKPGLYQGSSANISGKGFAGMRFVAAASTPAQFNDWLALSKTSAEQLDASSYRQLAKPSQNSPVAYFAPVDSNLFANIILKYMVPGQGV